MGSSRIIVSLLNIFHHLLSKCCIIKNVFLSLNSRYTQNGLLHMLDRNRRIKTHPERFQTCYETFDVIFTVEERVYDQVVEGF